MERYPQLSPEAQGELAADYQAGRAAQERLDSGQIRGVRNERQAREAVRRGERAAEYLVASNFRLVALIAREKAEARHGRERAAEMLPDLVGQANIALVEAAQVFNPTAGPSFPTYAAGKVRHAMLMALSRDHPIKVPPSWTRLKRIVSVRHPALQAELGRPPTRDELVADLHVTCMAWAYDKLSDTQKALPKAERLRAQQDRLRKQGMLGAIENLDEVLSQTQAVNYLDAPLSQDGSSAADLLPGEAVEMTSGLESDEMKAAVAQVLASLPERDREIISYRYGFVDDECWPYQRISVLYGVSAERIRQIEKSVISKLRLPGMGEHLEGFISHQMDE